MWRFIVPTWFRWAVSGEAVAVTEAVWAHLVTVREERTFPTRTRIVLIESGHVEDDDPNLDTS